jgi:hypothetical protein
MRFPFLAGEDIFLEALLRALTIQSSIDKIQNKCFKALIYKTIEYRDTISDIDHSTGRISTTYKTARVALCRSIGLL